MYPCEFTPTRYLTDCQDRTRADIIRLRQVDPIAPRLAAQVEPVEFGRPMGVQEPPYVHTLRRTASQLRTKDDTVD